MVEQQGTNGGAKDGLKSMCTVGVLVVVSICLSVVGVYNLLATVSNSGCNMTYMYPTYIPIPQPSPNSSDASFAAFSSVQAKYKLFLYHEGWRKIDFGEHLNKIAGVPLLFIPGNGGSYKQVRSLAAESDRAYQGGPLEPKFYHEVALIPEEGGTVADVHSFQVPDHYSRRLDWFAVDLDDEHSAMDGQILEQQSEYVVYAIHRILDLYKESFNIRSKEGVESSTNLPRSVILVGHSMGGFVARAAIVNPYLKKEMVETVLTLSSPHQSPPLALQPSLGHYYDLVNQEWRKGYEVKSTQKGNQLSEPTLSHVIVVSISGGIHDYQVRSKFESLDGIVPSSHGILIGSSGMKNVWLSMEHQTILWCNQLVVQVSHTLLSLIDSKSGQPFPSTQKRLTVFTKMLQSEIPPNFDWTKQGQSSRLSTRVPVQNENSAAGSHMHTFSPCPQSVHWSDDSLEKDLYIKGTTVTVLAMDGRRRWLDIQKLSSDGKDYFVFVTNLAPCSGVRLHLWPEKTKMTSNVTPSKRVVEVTSKMVEIPAGPAPMQIEPGSQTEQAPPSAIFLIGPDDMHGFRFLTISVAPRMTVSGRPPPAASMAVGQFFNTEDGKRNFSPGSLLFSLYANQDILLKEDHPLVYNLSFSISLGLLPVTVSLKTTGCGIKSSGLPVEEAGDVEHSRLCRLRCFPSVAIAWDSTSGLHVIPNLSSETIVVDSAPAYWDSTQESDKTTVLLLVDPHCSFKIGATVSVVAAAGRFLVLYYSQIIGFSIAVIFFSLMCQARAWELDLPLPSLLDAVVMNLRMPLSFLILAVAPILVTLVFSLLISQPLPPMGSFFVVSIICYAFANGLVIILILLSQLIISVTANIHAFIKLRWQVWEEKYEFTFFRRFPNLFSIFLTLKAVRLVRCNSAVTASLVSIMLVCVVHPALGLLSLLLSHALHCHTSLCSHARKREFSSSKAKFDEGSGQSNLRSNSTFDPLLPREEKPPNGRKSTRKYEDTQIESFNHRHGLLVLHLLATLMFVPSLVAWFQRIGVGQRLPWFSDFCLCIGVILHGSCGSKPEYNFLPFPFLQIQGQQVGLSFIYILSGYYCYFAGLALAPYRAFYAMAFVGVICTALRILEKRYKEKGEAYFRSRKHFHRH